MGLISTAISGAMAGGGEAGVQAGLQMQRQFGEQELLKMRADAEQQLVRTQATLAQQTHATNVEADIAAIPRRQAAELPGKVAEAHAMPVKLTPGESLSEGGKITVTAPTNVPPEHLKFYEAYADRMRAEADAIRSGLKYKEGASALPKVTKETNEDGSQHYLLDQNSGAVGKIIPGAAAKAAVSHWFSADEPAKEAMPDVVQWTYNGKVLKSGLSELYPAIGKRVGAPASGETPGAAPGAPTLEVGAVVKGMRYKGGDPNAKASWEQPPAAKPAPKGVVNAEVAKPAAVATSTAAPNPYVDSKGQPTGNTAAGEPSVASKVVPAVKDAVVGTATDAIEGTANALSKAQISFLKSRVTESYKPGGRPLSGVERAQAKRAGLLQ